MENFLKRMCIEHKELNKKMEKLETYMTSLRNRQEIISYAEFGYMTLQLKAMEDYSKALENRLSLHGVEVSESGSYYEKQEV